MSACVKCVHVHCTCDMVCTHHVCVSVGVMCVTVYMYVCVCVLRVCVCVSVCLSVCVGPKTGLYCNSVEER